MVDVITQLSFEDLRQTGRNKPKQWTTKDIQTLRDYGRLGAAELARILHRSESSIRAEASRRRISLRQPGRRAGLQLGQPRGVSWVDARGTSSKVVVLHEVRELAIAGKVDLAEVEKRLYRELTDPTPLCPACGRRPVRRTIGVCQVCHLEALAEAHNEKIAEIHAQRRLWTARQTLKRLREEVGVEAPGARPAKESVTG